MTVYHPTLKQLQYLVALHEHGHFGRAADACFVSQSTLSAGLRDLAPLMDVPEGSTLTEPQVKALHAIGEKCRGHIGLTGAECGDDGERRGRACENVPCA